jgi:4-amino-4-deoxy-L-arabinose transferase-like glycosyltransferase
MTGALPRRVDLAILLIILLACGLRLYAIDRQDIWGDEAFSIWLSGQSLPQVVAGGADTHPPLYPFLLHVWLRLAGSSSLATRFLSAMIGILTVPAVYILGRRALGQGVGRLAALLAAVSPVLIYYAQETRMYGLVTLLSALSVYWAMRAYREPAGDARGRTQTTIVWLAYFSTTLAATYTHYYAFFVILAENLVLIPILIRRRQRRTLGRWLVAQAAIGMAYLPWIAVQSGFLSGKASTRFAELGLDTAFRIAAETAAAFSGGLAIPPAARGWVAAPFLLAALLGLLVVVRRRQPEPWLVAAYLLVPLVLAWAVNPIMPFFYPRYLLLIAPAFYVLSSGGVAALRHLWRPLGIVGGAVLFAASGYGLHGYYTDDAYLKGRYGQMMAYIRANAQPGDGLLLANQLQRPIFGYYQPEGLEAYFFPRYEYPLEDPRTGRDLAAIAERHPRLWLVRFGNPAEYDPNGYLSRWLATHGSKAYFDGWVDADLALYIMTPPGSTIQHPLRADVGDGVQLLGYSLSAEQVAPGDTLLLTLYWQALEPMAERYTVFTHLLDANDQIQAQVDSEPQGGGLPTDRWATGQVIADNYALTVAASASPGPHVVEVGMYRLDTMERLPVRDPDTGDLLDDRVVLGTVLVEAP